jgi:hypothetical protein
VSEANAEYEATKRRKQPTLPEALSYVEAAASPSADRTAEMLYHLGSALKEGPRPSRGDEERVVDAISKLTGLLLESSSNSSSSNMPRIEQLDGRYLSQSSWALSQVRSVRGTAVRTLGLAIAEQALHGEVMKAEGWRNWSGVLYGLAKAGICCKDSEQVQQLFACAVTQRLPQLPAQKQGCTAQDVSNTFHATVTAGYSGSLEPLVLEVAGDLSRVMEGATAQAWANVLWACAKQGESVSGRLGQSMPVLLREGAASIAGLAKSGSAMSQDMSNALWALSKLGWYDASVYSTLSSAFLQKSNDAKPQECSNMLIGCAEACHWDSSMEGLAEFVIKQSEQQLGKWKEQELSNSLYAWAVLTAAGPPAASGSPSFKVMAQQLFGQVSKGGPSAFVDLHLRQLYLAHQVAVYGKLPGEGLSADAIQLEKVVASYRGMLRAMQTAVKNSQGSRGAIEQQVVEALQRVGYQVKVAQVVEMNGLKEVAPLLVQGVAVRVMSVDDYFHSPPDLLSGSKQIHNVLASWVCGSSIVVPEAEWAGLKGDPQQQQAYVAQRMQEVVSRG